MSFLFSYKNMLEKLLGFSYMHEKKCFLEEINFIEFFNFQFFKNFEEN
jgi:hypothetical protein